MANPDGIGGVGGIIGGVIITLCVIVIFNYYTSPIFNVLLYGLVPLLSYGISVGINAISQSNACENGDTKKLLLSGLPTVGTTAIALFISYFDICRIPIASIVAPLLIDKSSNSTSSETTPNIVPPETISTMKGGAGSCCEPSLTITYVEKTKPIIRVISYLFYLIFAMQFGITYGTSMVTAC